jgi:hypothetical protein
MIIRTAKGSFSATTFAALADWQAEMQGSLASVEIGSSAVDMCDAETAEDMAAAVLAELEDVIDCLRVDAGAAGDIEQVQLCVNALDGDVAALEACCAVICDAAAQD